MLKSIISFLAVLSTTSVLAVHRPRTNFVSLYVFPHGGIILDPGNIDYSNQPSYRPSSRQKAIRLNIAMKKAAEDLVKEGPDLIILTTPHGFNVQDRFLIIDSERASGDAGGGIWSTFKANFEIDRYLSMKLYKELDKLELPIELLSFGNGFQTVPLIWAEVVPFHFIQEASIKFRFKLPSVIYLGQPPTVNQTYVLNMGREIAKIATMDPEFAKRKIAFVISGDLSHYHGNNPAEDNGHPVVPSPYPYNPIGRRFDNFVVKWAKIDRSLVDESHSTDFLVTKAGAIESRAGHCGYNGLLLLHGMLEEFTYRSRSFKHHFYAYGVPSYFGMMVTKWEEIMLGPEEKGIVKESE